MTAKERESKRKELRRMMKSQRRERAEEILRQCVDEDPQWEEWSVELERLMAGQRLLLSLGAEERQKEEQAMALQRYRKDLEAFLCDKEAVVEWSDAELQRRQRLHHRIGKQIGKPGGESQRRMEFYGKSMNHEKRRRRRASRRLCLLLMLLLALFGLAAAVFFVLYLQADAANTRLEAALQSRQSGEIAQAYRRAEIPVYNFLNPDLINTRKRAKRCLAAKAATWSKLGKELSALEEDGDLRRLSLSKRYLIERSLEDNSQQAAALRERWHKLCAKEEKRQALNKKQVLDSLNAPLPTYHPSQNLAHDRQLLQEIWDELEGRQALYQATCSRYQLDAAKGKELQSLLERYRLLLNDVQALQLLKRQLAKLGSYPQYLRLVESFRAENDERAQALQRMKKTLPEPEELLTRIQELNGAMSPEIRREAKEALLNGGASFGTATHANQEQQRLRGEMMGSLSLNRIYYCLSMAGQPPCLSDNPPEIREEKVYFRLSQLDPSYHIGGEKQFCWGPPQAVFQSKCNTQGLAQAIGLDQPDFLLHANLAALLDKLLSFRDPNCPALAQAYLYDRLVCVAEAHDYRQMSGLPYSPTLRKDIASFRKLKKELGTELPSDCWLQPRMQSTNSAFASWFRLHRGHRYEEEIRYLCQALLSREPVYIGFMDESGRPVTKEGFGGNDFLYFSGQSLQSCAAGDHPEDALPFSPIFSPDTSKQ